MENERRENSIDSMLVHMGNLSSQNTAMLEEIKAVKHILSGNGTPEKGLVFVVAKHKEYFSTLTKVITALSVLALGELGFVIHTLITVAYVPK